MGEGLVGAGVLFGRETREVGRPNLVDAVAACLVVFGSGADLFGCDRAVAAALDLNAEGPSDDFFLAIGAVSASIAAMAFRYSASAAFLALVVSLHSTPGHSGSCVHGITMLSISFCIKASSFLSCIALCLSRSWSSRSMWLSPSSPFLVAKYDSAPSNILGFSNIEKLRRGRSSG